MQVYKHAQPALLHLVPACLSNILLSLLLIIQLNLLFYRGSPLPGTGDIKSMFQYEDLPTLRRRRPTNSLPAQCHCLSSSRSLFQKQVWQFVVLTQKIEEPLNDLMNLLIEINKILFSFFFLLSKSVNDKWNSCQIFFSVPVITHWTPVRTYKL